MVRRRSQAQQLLTPRHCGVVDGLDVDVVSLQQDVRHLGVQLSVAHLGNGSWKEIRVVQSFYSEQSGQTCGNQPITVVILLY